MINYLCLMLQAELNNWQRRDQLIVQLFETMKSQDPNSSIENSGNIENKHQLPLFKVSKSMAYLYQIS